MHSPEVEASMTVVSWLWAALLCVVAGTAGAVEFSPGLLNENPFTLPRDLVVPGTPFRVEVATEPPKLAGGEGEPAYRFDPNTDKATFWLRYQGGNEVRLPAVVKREDGRPVIELRMPELSALKGIEGQGRWSGDGGP